MKTATSTAPELPPYGCPECFGRGHALECDWVPCPECFRPEQPAPAPQPTEAAP